MQFMDKGRDEKKKLSPGRKLLIASGLLIAAALVQHLVFDMIGVEARGDLHMVDTAIGVSYGFDMHPSFYAPGGRSFFFAARDGVQNLTSGGELRWQDGFNLALPLMVGRGDIVAIGEPNGHKIYVYGPDGYLFSVNLPHPAIYFTVNASGYLSVIMQTGSNYIIEVFHSDDRHYYRMPIYDTNVFPFSVDVSNCGTYVAKALLDVDTLILSRLTFSYVRRAESRAHMMTEGMFRSYRFDNEFIVRVRFTDCGRVIAVTDKQIIGFMADSGHQGSEWSIPLHNRPDKLYIGDNILAFVTGDAFLNDPNADAVGVLHIYNFDGRHTGSFDLGRRATHLTMNHNTVLAGTDRTFYAINQQGNLLWEHSAIQDVRDMIFLDNTDTILLAGGTRAMVMRRIRD